MKRGAFTIIELLVVIVIISLLTGLASTSYLNAQRNARDNARRSNVAAIGSAVEAFYQVNRAFPGLTAKAAASTLSTLGSGAYDGCIVMTAGKNPVYYSYPRAAGSSGAARTCSAASRNGTAAGHLAADYAPDPTWIPGLGTYLNPVPVERRYRAGDGSENGTLTTSDVDSGSTLGGPAQTYTYRQLGGGYLVGTSLEGTGADGEKLCASAGCTPANTPKADTTGSAGAIQDQIIVADPSKAFAVIK